MKKFLLFVLALAIMICDLSIITISLAEEGDYGSIHWTINKGVLSFTGEGELPASGPWSSSNKKVKKIIFDSGITAYYDYGELPALTSIVFYNKVIGDCSVVTKLSEIRFTGESPVFDASKLPGTIKTIEFDNPDAEYIRDGDFLYNRSKTILYYCFSNKGKIVVPDGVEEIGSGAFHSKSKIQNVSFPASLVTIGNDAFSQCDGLKKIVFPDSLKKIGCFAFAFCKKIPAIEIPASVESIGSWAFAGCSKAKTISFLGDSIKFIKSTDADGNEVENDDGAVFAFCESLEEITLPACEDIRERFFWMCKKLKKVNLNENTGHIGENAFYECEKLTSLYIPDNTEFDYETFLLMPKKFKIQCHSGSKAEKLAKDFKLNYEIVSD